MKLVSWNLNGIRAVEKKGLSEILDYMNPDIIGFQETKAQDEQVINSLKDLLVLSKKDTVEPLYFLN